MAEAHSKRNVLFVKIAVWIAICLVAVMALIIYLVVMLSSANLEKTAQQQLQVVGAEKVRAIDLALNQVIDFNRSVAASPTIRSLADTIIDSGDAKEAANQATQYLSSIYPAGDTDYENVFIDVQDIIVADSLQGVSVGYDMGPANESGDYSGRRVLKTGETYVGHAQISPITDLQILMISSPIYSAKKPNETVAVVNSAVLLNRVADNLLRVEKSSASETEALGFYLLDESGLVLSSNDQEAILNLDFSTYPTVQAALQNTATDASSKFEFEFKDQAHEAVLSDSIMGRFRLLVTLPESSYLASVNSQAKTLMWMLSIAGIVSVLLLTFGVYLITKPLLGRLSQAMKTAEIIASSDLSRPIVITGNDEGSRLMSALQDMQERLKQTVVFIIDKSSQLSNMSSMLHQQAQSSNSQLENQTGALQNAASAITELTTVFESVSQNADLARTLANTGVEHTQKGETSVNQAITSIENLASDLENTTNDVSLLEKDIGEITSVLEVIQAIAEQTNLLALNAAIEAARAGEMGRGFAVVADEVRNLAHRTSESITQIESIITQVQARSKTSAQAIRASNEKAKDTVAQAKLAGEALISIGQSIQEISAKNIDIAGATQQQSAAVQEIDRTLNQVQDSANLTLDKVKETNHSSDSVSGIARELEDLVHRFNIGDGKK
ncbi:hypothetical protein DN730_06690 [Marinomonas piezotolerans]|uniref:Methyl-accepting chemotaxis protein n=1 Tax=Marinomonas piezotolerans TaxID=2213058 RepID=A0A370UBW7_9GAMM|nr:methyl-accepting chemotaxis protein [Marinomonas piezotolerans]RDL45292.1 hypothetical protein DN730_06690 [Marinomonas piezotolerans]